MPECCIYTRISSDRGMDTDEEGAGVTRQEEDCRELARLCGWTVAHVYTDNDASAYTEKRRPQFEAMLEDLKSGRYTGAGLICWHDTRLLRRPDDLERLIAACSATSSQIRFVQATDIDVSTASGKMIARIMASIARQESEHKAERQRRANLQRAEAGGWWSSHRVFGYTTVGELHPSEADLVRQAGVDILAGVSMTAVARRWNAADVTTTRGAAWNVSRIKRMIINPRYAGIRTYTPKGQTARVMGPGSWTPIFDPDTHNGVLALLNDTSRARPGISWERRYIGSYRFICGKCGAKMGHSKSTIRGYVYHRYTCTASPHLVRVQPALDSHVENTLLGYLGDGDNLHRIMAAKEGDGVDPAELRAQRVAFGAQKDGLAALFAEGVLDGPAVRRESAKLTTKIEALDAKLAGLARRSPLAELLAEGADKFTERWQAASPDIRGKVIDELFVVVVHPAPRGHHFRPEFIEFRWH